MKIYKEHKKYMLLPKNLLQAELFIYTVTYKITAVVVITFEGYHK